MGFGFRKSINLGGGVRLNVGKKGMGISAGVKGFRVGTGPSGTRMRTSIPGTGVYYEKRLGTKSKNLASHSPTQQSQVPSKIKLGLFKKLVTPQEEVSFIDGVNLLLEGKKDQSLLSFREAVNKKSDFTDAHFCIALSTTDDKEQLNAIQSTLKNKQQYRKHFEKYGIAIGTILPITDELNIQIANDDLGLILLAAEIFQDNDLHDEAIQLLNNSAFTDNPVVILSLGELYYDAGKIETSIQMLQQLENNDSIGTTALLYQGMAFRKINQFDAAIEVLKSALRRKKDRSPQLLLEARYQLAFTYELVGDIKKAKKEYEKILAEDFTFSDVKEKLEKL